jgi:hypothetical protein
VKFKCTTVPAAANTLELNIQAQPQGVFTANTHLDWYVPSALGVANFPIDANVTLPRRVCRAQIINHDTNSNSYNLTVFAQEV